MKITLTTVPVTRAFMGTVLMALIATTVPANLDLQVKSATQELGIVLKIVIRVAREAVLCILAVGDSVGVSVNPSNLWILASYVTASSPKQKNGLICAVKCHSC